MLIQKALVNKTNIAGTDQSHGTLAATAASWGGTLLLKALVHDLGIMLSVRSRQVCRGGTRGEFVQQISRLAVDVKENLCDLLDDVCELIKPCAWLEVSGLPSLFLPLPPIATSTKEKSDESK